MLHHGRLDLVLAAAARFDPDGRAGTHPAGPQLAAILAGVDRSALSDEDLVRLAQARQRLAAHLQAQLLADIHTIGQRTGGLVGGSEEERRGMVG